MGADDTSTEDPRKIYENPYRYIEDDDFEDEFMKQS